MANKESKHRKDAKKKPLLSLKERRFKKHEKKRHSHEHHVESYPIIEM